MPWRHDGANGAPTRVFLVRHGQSTFNKQHRFQGRSDEPVLTGAGASAAAVTGSHLARFRFDEVITSPLRRAHVTAEIIREALRDTPPLEVSQDLRELDLGMWQGMSMQAVEQIYPEAFRTWRHRPDQLQLTAVDGSAFFPVRDLFEQAQRFWRRLLSHESGKTILLVTHGGTARALISTAAGIGMEQFHSLQHSNLGISILEFSNDSGTATIEALNSTAHLGEAAPKLKEGKRGLRAVLVAGEQTVNEVQRTITGLSADFWCSAADEESRRVAAALARPSDEVVAANGTAWWEGTAQKYLDAATNRATATTGVFIAPRDVLSGWLASVLKVDDRRPWKPFSTAVLHYPGLVHAPVIQMLQPAACEKAQV